jgi:hypothetical protein
MVAIVIAAFYFKYEFEKNDVPFEIVFTILALTIFALVVWIYFCFKDN